MVIVTTITMEATMKIDIPTLVEKWTEFHDESEDWTEKNLSLEFLDDLKDLSRG